MGRGDSVHPIHHADFTHPDSKIENLEWDSTHLLLFIGIVLKYMMTLSTATTGWGLSGGNFTASSKNLLTQSESVLLSSSVQLTRIS